MIKRCIMYLFNKKDKKKDNLLEIKYNLSSGIPFRWEFEIENSKVCDFVKRESNAEKTKEPICGGNVETNYYFKGLKKGKTTIIFKCINFADNYLSEIHEYKVMVDDNLNISLISKEERRLR